MTIHTDPELLRLLVQELERHSAVIAAWADDSGAAQRALHALKGSAGLAGERELAAVLERLGRRVREGDDRAFDEASSVVRTAVRRLSAGESPVLASWPVPPDDLAARRIDPTVRAQYAAEVTDRLARIDDALATSDDPVDAARILYRHVHTMKGAASAAGDEPMTWFCHGLEEKLRGADSTEAARSATHEVARWRVVLGALLDDPETALAMLGARQSSPSHPWHPSHPPSPRAFRAGTPRRIDSEPPARPSGFDEATATIRVPAADVDRLLERLETIDRARERVASRAERGRESASSVRDLRALLLEALRLIGPSRPWGAPAAALGHVDHVAQSLRTLSEELEVASTRLRATEQVLREGVADAKKQLSAMRQTAVGRIFARLTTAVESEARRAGRSVIVRTRGADETIDRRLAEQLVEPCLQLVRNAVAHGIEPPEVRAAAGKPASGTIALAARKIGNRLRLTITDDGAGVDHVGVRARAAGAGLVTPAIAQATDDDTLLSLLFQPGFSTRESTDLLAGRGIGLDIARAGIQRMGGAIRLSSRAGQGFSARVDVPIESGFVNVLWVRAGREEFALPAANARRVSATATIERPVPHLLACLGARDAPARFAIDLDLQSDDPAEAPAIVGVDGVGSTAELLIRPLGSLVAGVGPFAGAIVRGDGSLRLAIDAWAIAPRVRALAAAPPRGPAGG
jgi:two-component system, chemotaxis family, sensor kinase CheA